MRYPFDPVREYLEMSHEYLEMSHTELADRLNVTSRTIARWSTGGLNTWTADRVACQIGFHPSLLCPEWFEAA